MPTKTHCQLLIFCRAPIPGRAKTRLIPMLGRQGAAKLSDTLLRACLARLNVSALRARGIEVVLWASDYGQHPRIRELAQRYHIASYTQVGQDLGQRMHYAVKQGFKRASNVMVIGTDCLQLDEAYVYQALDTISLEANAMKSAAADPTLGQARLVLGPALDGGYGLIGMNQLLTGIFDGIEWGGPEVLAQTLTRARMSQAATRCLKPLRDLDTPMDLHYFKRLGLLA